MTILMHAMPDKVKIIDLPPKAQAPSNFSALLWATIFSAPCEITNPPMQPCRKSESHHPKEHERSPSDNNLLSTPVLQLFESGMGAAQAVIEIVLLSTTLNGEMMIIIWMLGVDEAMVSAAIKIGVVGGWLDGRGFEIGRDWSLSRVAGVETSG